MNMELGGPHSGSGGLRNIEKSLFWRDPKLEPPNWNRVVAIPTELFPHLMLGYCHEFLNVRFRSTTLPYPLHNKYLFASRMAQSVLHLPYVQRDAIKIISYWSLCVLLNEVTDVSVMLICHVRSNCVWSQFLDNTWSLQCVRYEDF
jgi:hypothetical protein